MCVTSGDQIVISLNMNCLAWLTFRLLTRMILSTLMKTVCEAASFLILTRNTARTFLVKQLIHKIIVSLLLHSPMYVLHQIYRPDFLHIKTRQPLIPVLQESSPCDHHATPPLSPEYHNSLIPNNKYQNNSMSYIN